MRHLALAGLIVLMSTIASCGWDWEYGDYEKKSDSSTATFKASIPKDGISVTGSGGTVDVINGAVEGDEVTVSLVNKSSKQTAGESSSSDGDPGQPVSEPASGASQLGLGGGGAGCSLLPKR